MIKLIICDLDDTLLSEYDYVMSQYRHIAEFLSNRESIDGNDAFKTLKYAFDNNLDDPFDKLIEKYKLNKSIKPDLIEVYRYSVPNLKLYPDTEDFLEQLSRSGIIMTMLTDGNTRRQNMKIDALGIRQYFDRIVINEPAEFKPCARGYESVLEGYSFRPKEILCIGDNPQKDFYYPLEKGFMVIKLNRFVNKQMPDGHPEITSCDNYSQIIDYIENTL